MIYSKSFGGVTAAGCLPPHPLCSIYNSMGNCWVGSSEGFCCNWFKMQDVFLVVRKGRKGYPVCDVDSVCMRRGQRSVQFKPDQILNHCNKHGIAIRAGGPLLSRHHCNGATPIISCAVVHRLWFIPSVAWTVLDQICYSMYTFHRTAVKATPPLIMAVERLNQLLLAGWEPWHPL